MDMQGLWDRSLKEPAQSWALCPKCGQRCIDGKFLCGCRIEGLTIAPEQKWMMFWIRRNALGPVVDLHYAWVSPLHKVMGVEGVRLSGCSCLQWFYVHLHLDEEWDSIRRKHEAAGGFTFICKCYGEFIE